ncbi:MAG: hypothetical protein O2904_00955 [bacterium]|nr:hypothetical protein [bacterium]
MNRNRHPHFNVLTALLVGIALVPVATQSFIDGPDHKLAELVSLFRSTDDDGRYFESAPDIRAYANANRDAFRTQRRAYTRAVDRCRDRLRDGEEIECPDFNNLDTYIEKQNAKAAAPQEKIQDTKIPSDAKAMDGTQDANEEEVVEFEEEEVNTDIIELSTIERKMLRSYVRAGFCSERAGSLIFRLCQSLVDDSAATPMGYINDNVKLHSLHSGPPTTLKLRLQMVDEAISGIHGKRSDGTRPMRPNSRRVTGDE